MIRLRKKYVQNNWRALDPYKHWIIFQVAARSPRKCLQFYIIWNLIETKIVKNKGGLKPHVSWRMTILKSPRQLGSKDGPSSLVISPPQLTEQPMVFHEHTVGIFASVSWNRKFQGSPAARINFPIFLKSGWYYSRNKAKILFSILLAMNSQ